MSATLFAATAGAVPERGFVTLGPARSWEEGLIAGNGKHGALVIGQPLNETIVLNHARLYMPLHPPLPPPHTASHLPEIRSLISRGEYQKAADLVVQISKQEGYGQKRWTDPFIPAFDLRLEMPEAGEPKAYSRSVDFETGVATVRWADNRGTFERRLFVSRRDDVIVVSIKGSVPGQVDCEVSAAPRPTTGQGGWWPESQFTNGIKTVAIAAEGEYLTYRSEFQRQWPGSLQGYEGAARVFTKGGKIRAEGDSIKVSQADELIILTRLAVSTNFAQSRLAGLKRELGGIKPDFNKLLEPHAKLHGGLFKRMQLDLNGGAERRLPVEELIRRSRVGATVPALLEKQFDVARYAVICSTGELFPNLQGIWNGTWGPPWSADFTQNGNVQSAIAGNLPGNLAECLLPYFDYLEAQLPDYRKNAQRLFGCRGIHVASRTSTHGLNNHFDATWPMTFWTAGAGWASHFYYEYYLYTGDRKFLRNRAYPFMKEAALFYEDFLVKGADGKYQFNPSYSPENNPANSASQACIDATMDVSVAKELLGNCITAAETLGIDGDKVQKWRQMLGLMPGYLINSEGALKEWNTPLLEDNYSHRHCSHLYALFGGMPEEVRTNDVLRGAFSTAIRKRIEFRRSEPTGEMAFGAVQIGLAAAALGDAASSYEVLEWLANLYWTPSLTSTHNKHSLFNLDICGGMPAVMIRMFVASEPGALELLPALPPQMPKGSISGVRARGQLTVGQLAWEGQGVSLVLNSAIRQEIKLRTPDGIDSLKIIRGSGKAIPPALPQEAWTIRLPAGKEVSLEIVRGRRSSLQPTATIREFSRADYVRSIVPAAFAGTESGLSVAGSEKLAFGATKSQFSRAIPDHLYN